MPKILYETKKDIRTLVHEMKCHSFENLGTKDEFIIFFLFFLGDIQSW